MATGQVVVDAQMSTRLSQLMAILPAVIVVIVSAVGLMSAPGLRWASLLAAAPALAAVRYTPRGVFVIGGVSFLIALGLGMRTPTVVNDRPQVLAALAVVTLVSMLSSALRLRRERVLAVVRSVAETAQHAVLAPVPPQVGPLRCAVTYNAAAEARIGGDLYAVLDTPYGVRALMADVRGKGLPAVRTAAQVLGVFREAAYDEADLLAIVERIERSLSRSLGGDDFVTALVAAFPKPDGLELVNCGHQPPLLVHDDGVTPVMPNATVPPLGLAALSEARPTTQLLPFGPGDQLLMYTDGVTEARDRAGTFYPLSTHLARHLANSPEQTLSSVQKELRAYVGGRLDDDAAMLLLERPRA